MALFSRDIFTEFVVTFSLILAYVADEHCLRNTAYFPDVVTCSALHTTELYSQFTAQLR
jgi:hypothetical protein